MRCFAIVEKIGEIFAEFGYSVEGAASSSSAITDSNNNNTSDNNANHNNNGAGVQVMKWQLRVMNETHDVLSEDEILDSATKVIKVSPSTVYLVQVRVMPASVMEWTPWSEVIRTRTFSPVKTSLHEIGEDFVRLQWDRPIRDCSTIAPEVNTDAVRKVAEISQFCLRVVREVDMFEVFTQEFATGTRTYTLHNLRPGTAHIVYTRYRTLIGTLTNWSEVTRFYTQNTYELQLTKRAEDTFTVRWSRQVSDAATVGYVMPDSSVHRFEMSIVGEGLDIAPLEISSTAREHCFKDLVPGALYRVRIRCLTRDGRWGVHSKVLKVTLAQRPTLYPIATGETFMSLTWQRAAEEAQESDIEWHIRSASSDFETSKAVFIRKGAHNKKFTIESLVSNTLYFIKIRTSLMGEWGMWSEEQQFMTAKSMSIQLLERGENFFTVTWPIQSTSKDLENDCRFELVLVRVEEETGDREMVMQEEVVKDTDEGYRLQNLLPNTTYELKGRAWQRNRVEGTCLWGQYSNTLRVRTLQNVALKITSVGEDFAELSWTRALALKTGNANEDMWKDLKYEVIIGCVDTGEDGVVHKEIVDTNCTIDNLLPATTYTVSVRACDDREQWGAWSHARFHTLAAIKTSIHEIGETFVRVMWRREDDLSLQELLDHEEENEITDQPPITQGDPVAKEFTLYIFSNDYDSDMFISKATGYPRGGNSEVSLVTSIQSHHSAFRVCDLIPDRTYTAVIRASTPTGRWGIWSEEVRFHTTAPFRIPVNTLHVGENYIHLTWNRDERPSLPKNVLIDEYVVTSQQIRFRDTETNISKELTVRADQREEKLRGLHPATAYCVQIRACNKSGEWGQWSAPVIILTRATILCKSVEVAEDYAIVAWERPKAANPNNYATGKGTISSYELRVSNKEKTHLSTFVIESPFKISNLLPNTYYCIEIKANYNDAEWGMWSTPLWCLTMQSIQTIAHDIGEEQCTVRVRRPIEERSRVPEDDGNRANDTDRILAFGRHRTRVQLCVTTAKVAPPPHAPKAGTFVNLENPDSINLPVECRDDKVVYLVEVPFDDQDILHTIPNLKANTIYCVAARSRLDANGDWGMWSTPVHRFITVSKTEIEFLDIGESFVKIRWERGQQDMAGVAQSGNVARGVGVITMSRIKIRDSSQHFSFIDVDTDATVWTIPNLKPAETYGISIQLMTSSGEWGVWSTEAKVRTVPPMRIAAENITEDAVWLSWVRESDLSATIAADTCMNLDTNARQYELSIRGEGGFNYTRVVEDGSNCFFRGLQPDTVYEAWIRTTTGLWSRRYFATLPTIRVTFGNVGEHFAVIEWRRNLPSCLNKPSANGLEITQATDTIEKFCLRVELPGEGSVLYELPYNLGSYRLRDLKPSSEYRVWMCAQGFEGVWGLWNTETRVRTLPSLDLGIDDIGEDYVSVSWGRSKWACPHPIVPNDDPAVKTWEIQGSTTAYEVQVIDEDGAVVGTLGTSHTTTKCTIGRLKLKSVYTVCVRAKDTYSEWGMWSEAKRFVTLQPVKVNVLKIGEDFVELEWQRRTRLRILRSRNRRQSSISAALNAHGARNNSRVRELPDDYDGDEFEEEDEEFYDEEDEEDEEYEEDEEADEEFRHHRSHAADNHRRGSRYGAAAGQAADDGEELMGANDVYPADALRGDEDVKQWAIRVYGSSVFGGQPGSETDFREFFLENLTTTTAVKDLLANHVYTIGIRAQNTKGEWGHWSAPITLRTQPLIRVNVLDVSETSLRISWVRPAYIPAVSGEGILRSSPSAAAPNGAAAAVATTPLAAISEAHEEGEDDGMSNYRFSFPEPHAQHSYQVSIIPLEGESPFPATDENVVDGARVYETSQPALQLITLTPGTRYRVVIKEQMLDDGGRALLEGAFGMECEPLIVETILPMEVLPVDIGENQSVLTWQRKARPANALDGAIAPVRSNVRTAFYQLRVARLDAEGLAIHEGSMALKLTKVLRAPDASYLLTNLSPNAIYAVCVQAQLENGTWGPWSGEAKFVTQKRLTLSVDSINQDSLTFSWFRQGPDWMPQRSITVGPNGAIQSVPLPNSTPMIVGGVGATASNAAAADASPTSPLERAIAERDRKAQEIAAIPPHLRSVVAGDYNVQHFEVVVEGITCVHSSRTTIDASSRNTFISGLQPNHVYCAHVRSLTVKGQWSLCSPKLMVCTLNPLQLQVGHYTECNAMVAWYRPAQTIADHEKVILKVQAAARAEAEHAERQARFGRQQLIQSKSEVNETASEEELALSALMIEQAIIDAEEAAYFLSPQNVHMGLAEVSGYQVRLYGEGGEPIIAGNSHLLPTAPKPKTRRRRTTKAAGADGADNDDEDDAGPSPVLSNGDSGKLLMDVKMNPKTTFVKVGGLREGTRYDFAIRSRNALSEWGPWSPLSGLRTLDLLSLCQSRFGEHYINLYWHRPSEATLADYEARKQVVARYGAQFRDMSVEVLEAKKKELTQSEYTALIETLRDWRAQQRWVTEYDLALTNGEGEVLAAPDMPVVGYHLRILNEAGQVTDKYFESGDIRQFTLTGLTHNVMYVVLMCADYGNGEWGTWSQPLKVMTQNTIQLNIAYVGETFVDATWKRAPNKKPNPLDADTVIIASPTQQGTGRHYEASLKYVDPTTGAEKDERRKIKDAANFRLDNLHCDTHYRIRIREWDPKGEWGMWGTERRCVTLAAMSSEVVEIGEDWVDVKWSRLLTKTRINYDDPMFIQRPVENIHYYLQVEEVAEDATSLDAEADKVADDPNAGAAVGEDDVDIGLFLQNQREKQQREGAGGDASAGAGTVPQPPQEREPIINTDGSPSASPYLLTKRFDNQTTEFRIPHLSSDRFYKIQVMCETTGGQLGVWSPALVALTMCKVKVRCDLIDELATRVSWSRENPRRHPTLGATIRPITAVCEARNYQLVAQGVDSRSKKYSIDLTFDHDTLDYKLTDLILNGCYVVRVRATDSKNRKTLWSDDVNFVTLKRLKIHAYRITETAIHMGWGRDEQVPSEYPATSTPILIPASDKITQFHLCVFNASDMEAPLLERNFAGNVNTFVMPQLDPNTAYVVRARSSNLLGEWSLWSEDRIIYTMKAIVTNIVTVGESYIAVNWARSAPDELADIVRGAGGAAEGEEGGTAAAAASQEGVAASPADAGSDLDAAIGAELDSVVDAELNGNDAALKALQMRRQFPLLDKPLTFSPVYVSARTAITRYCVSISRLNDTSDPWTAVIDGSLNAFKIPNLRHDTVYEISVRACYGSEDNDDDWGMWSSRVKSGTTNLFQIAVKQIGENYLHAEWRRNPNTFAEYGVVTGKPEETLCYQFKIYDFTEVAIGDEAKANLDKLLVHDQFLQQKSEVFNDLNPNRRYRLSVRRWCRPANMLTAGAAASSPSGQTTSPGAADGAADAHASVTSPLPAGASSSPNGGGASAELRRQLEAAGAIAGTWSEPISVATHKPMVVLVSDISESGMLLRWERDPDVPSNATRHCVKVPYTINSFHMHINELARDGSPIVPAESTAHHNATQGQQHSNNGPQPLRFNQEFQADEVSFRARDLKPDTVYLIEIRCSADKIWGQWSRHVLVITLPRLQVSVGSIGEDYAALSWGRKIRHLTAADGTVAITGSVANVEKYELEMEGLDHHFDLKKRFKATRTTYRVRHLEPSKAYSIIMRSCEYVPGTTTEEWSVWSDRVTFATLKPLQLNFGKIAEQFVHVSWGRDPQTQEEYSAFDKNIILGSTEALSYHFCVFTMDQMPSAAIVDKQFDGTVTTFRVDNLAPNTNYIMIVRGCNDEQQWGLWGEERVVTTQRVITTDIVSIGENYVAVKWSRLAPDDEARRMMLTDAKGGGGQLAQRKQPTGFHICLTSESETVDRRFTSEECTHTADEARTPMFTIRGLRSDTKYILSLQACYGGDEWGTWSAPVTFLTVSNVSVKVSNITESSAEFTWGRAQQNPTHASDPNILVWRGTVVRYQLLLRKVDEMRAQEMRSREEAMNRAEMQQQITGGPDEGTTTAEAMLAANGAMVPTTTDADGVTIPMSAVAAGGNASASADAANGSSAVTAVGAVPHFFFEQEMDVKLVKYVQTLSRIDRLEVNTEYHFQVRALDAHNEWGYWSEVFFDTPPNPPQNLMMRKDGPMILLSWDPPSRAHNYMYCIEQSVAKDPNVKEKDGGNALTSGSNAARAARRDGSAMDWRVVDTVEDTMCRVRAFGPIHRVRCRIKCCRVNTPTFLFSRYSTVVTVNSNVGIEPVNDLRLTSLSKSTAVIEWAKADPPLVNPMLASASSSSGALSPAPPAVPRNGGAASSSSSSAVAYRVMLAIGAQPLINIATLRANVFELTDLSPSTNYVVQVIVETEAGSCQRNPTLRFSTKSDADRGVYKWAPGQQPLGDLTPAPQDRTLLMVGMGDSLATNSPRGDRAGMAQSARLPTLDRDRYGRDGPMTPRPPASKKLLGSTNMNTPLTNKGAMGASLTTPRGHSAGSALLGGGGTPATQGRRPPGTAPHGATRSGSNGARKPAPPNSAAASSGRSVGGALIQHSASGANVVLPPVAQQRPPSSSGIRQNNYNASASSKAVEHFDYVGFVPSDDEK